MIDQLLQEIYSQLSPQAQQIFLQADDQTAAMLVQLYQAQGIQAVEQALIEFAVESGALDPAMAGAQQPLSPAGVDQGVPPQVPPDALLPGTAPQPVMPPQQEAQPPMMGPQPLPESEGPPTPPKWQPEPPRNNRYQHENPSLERVLEDAKIGRELWRPRDVRIAQDTSLYHLEIQVEVDDALEMQHDTQFVDDGVLHRRADPAVLVDRITGMTEARPDRITIQVPKRHESSEYEEAAQRFEDYVRSCRLHDESLWFRRGSYLGDPQPPLYRKEAGLMALEGGFGWKWDVNPDNEAHPFEYEVVPLSHLYPLGHATTRQFVLPLHIARSLYKSIEKAYPLGASTGRGSQENTLVRIIEWADTGGFRYAAAYQLDSPVRSKGDAGWIVRPKAIGFGFPMFNYVIWGGTPAPANSHNNSVHRKYVGYGVLTPLRRTYNLINLVVSAVATGAIKAQNPPVHREIQEGRDMSKVPPLSLESGAENKGRVGERVTPILFDVAASSSGVAFIQALAQEVQNATPPLLTGEGASSGFEYLQRSEDSNAMMIMPIMDALTQAYQLIHEQRGLLAYRYSRRPKGERKGDYAKLEYYDEYQFTGTSKKGYSYHGTIGPDDLEKSGVSTQVRFTDRSLTEQIQVASLVTQLVNAHLMSQEQALIRLGNDDPVKEIKKIFQDAALMQPEMLKAMVEASIMEGGNEMLIAAWQRAFSAQQAGSPPSQPGTPSMAAQPGGVQGGPPPTNGGQETMMGSLQG